MDILIIIRLLLVLAFFSLSLVLIVYSRYLVEKALKASGGNRISVVVSVITWLAPAVLSLYVSLSIFVVTGDMENVYYIGSTHLVLSYLGSLIARKVALTEGVL